MTMSIGMHDSSGGTFTNQFGSDERRCTFECTTLKMEYMLLWSIH
jgi:hypothetical protein